MNNPSELTGQQPPLLKTSHPLNWICPSCSTENYPDNPVCRQCQSSTTRESILTKFLAEITPEQQLQIDNEMLQNALKVADARIAELESLSCWKAIAKDGLPGVDMKDDQQIMLANTHRGFTYKWGTIKTTAEQLARYSQFTHWRLIDLPS